MRVQLFAIGPARAALGCRRAHCGACLNVCPVYRKGGGGPVYSGPMGAVLVPLLAPLLAKPWSRGRALPRLQRRFRDR